MQSTTFGLSRGTLVGPTLILAMLSGFARADIVHLKDGTTLEGTIEDAEALLPESQKIRVVTRFGESAVPRSEILSIEWDPRDVKVLDPDSFADAEALKNAADLEYELGLQASQNARKDELVGGLHSQTAIGHLENARNGYTELATRDPGKGVMVERRVNEINSHIFWCRRFGGKVDDLGLDASGKALGEEDAAEKERERVASEALEQARKFHKENPKDLGYVLQRYLDVVEEHPGTIAASDARELISDVQDELLAQAKRRRAGEEEEAEDGEGGATAKKRDPAEAPARPEQLSPEDVRAQMLTGLTQKFESDGYRVLAHTNYEAGLAEHVADQLEACLEVTTALTGIKQPKATEEDDGRLEVLVLANQEDFSKYTSGRVLQNQALQRALDLVSNAKKSVLVMPEGHQLVCYRTSGLDEELRRVSVEQLLRARLGQVPAFLASGLGHYLELAELDKKGKKVRGSRPDSDMQATLERAISPKGGNWRRRLEGSNSLLPLEELLTNPPERADVFDIEDLGRRVRQEARSGDNRSKTFAAEAWAFIHWSLHGKGPKSAVKKLTDILAEGKSVFDAYRGSFGRANSSGKMDDAFEKFIKGFAR